MKSPWARARVLEASDRDYLEILLSFLEKARRDITVSLYLFEPADLAPPEHPVNRIAGALLRARGRGVRVRLLFNSNFRFRPKTEVGKGAYFEKLLQAGVEITTLLPARRLHDKLIVIDSRFVIEGSMNWSESALQSNFESVSVIDSPAHARKKLERIRRIMEPPRPKSPPPDSPLLPVPETVEIPLALFGKKYLPQMVRTSDKRAMDLYLLLLGQAAARSADRRPPASVPSNLELDLETAGRALGLPADWERYRIRRQMLKVLRKLAVQYGLIEMESSFAEDVKVSLKNFPGETVGVAGRYLEAGFLSSEKFTGAVFLALAGEILKREGKDVDSFSAPQLEKRFAVARSNFVRARSDQRVPADIPGFQPARLRRTTPTK